MSQKTGVIDAGAPEWGHLVLSVAGSASPTLTQAQWENEILEFTGVITANISVILPLLDGRQWTIYNNTTGAFTVTVIGATGAGVSVTQGSRMKVYCDGTNIVPANSDGVNMGGLQGGQASVNVAGGTDVTLTPQQAAVRYITLTGALTASINLIVPSVYREYVIFNNTTGAFTLTVKTAAGTGIAVGQGKRAIVTCDGTNVVRVTPDA